MAVTGALEAAVEARLASGQCLAQIEDWIDGLGVDEDLSSALCLLAWSLRSTDEGRTSRTWSLATPREREHS